VGREEQGLRSAPTPDSRHHALLEEGVGRRSGWLDVPAPVSARACSYSPVVPAPCREELLGILRRRG
jgi:hypothetical protein